MTENDIRLQFEEILKKNKYTESDADKLCRAYEYASQLHVGQKRKSGDPYIMHPVAVAEMLADAGMDLDTICAGILHDVVEDTEASFNDVKSKFGIQVAYLVDGVTKLTRLPYYTKEEEEMENLRKMFMAMAQDIRVIIIKLFDRLHNMRTLEFRSPEKQREIAFETMMIYAPIAHRLGMNNVKVELEDISIHYLDPIGYNEILSYLESSSGERNTFLSIIIKRIEDRLLISGIKAKVQGRVKHIYGIYRKVYMQAKDISEVYDIYAVRVIVDTVNDCYNVLGMVHDLFRPMPGRFKDYISTPKPNMYQSLHTTVIGREGKPFEVQIRTYDMHNTAEFGIAAHWKYKHGLTQQGDEAKFAWVRQLLENQQTSEAEDFIQNLRTDLFSDEVFVFTPKGDVINLPAGATPIDFAYAIHSAVGNRMFGAKVSGKMVQLDHHLQNGDIVEVLTSNAAKGPSRDWLKIARTGEARNKIKQWFKKERREENIQTGKEELESELKANNLLSVFMQEDVKLGIVKKMSFQTVEDMYAGIGYGGVSVRKIINRVQEEASKQEKAAKISMIKASKPSKATSGVIVEGVDNCLVKFARCCTPIPGDKIVGFVTKGYGVSVHRADCPNVVSLMEKKDDDKDNRFLTVRWDESDKTQSTSTKHENKYQSALAIMGKNRIGFLADIANVLFDMRIEVSSIAARDLGNGNAILNAVINLTNAEQLGQVMVKLKKVTGVSDVKRSIQ